MVYLSRIGQTIKYNNQRSGIVFAADAVLDKSGLKCSRLIYQERSGIYTGERELDRKFFPPTLFPI